MIDKNSLPVGLGMSLALDMEAMKTFANLSDSGKQQLIDYIENSTTGDEAKYRVKEVVRNLHDGEGFR